MLNKRLAPISAICRGSGLAYLRSLKFSAHNHAAFIRSEAARLGFSACGISKAEFLEAEAPRLETWLKAGSHGSMAYMENYFDKRLDPTRLVDGAKSVVSLLFNYFPSSSQPSDAPKVSKYAYGEDYHHVLRDKLNELLTVLRDRIGDISGRAFVDSAPVMDKVWAAKSGLGWIGKSTNLVTRKGSFFFIAELIIDLELEPDAPSADFCGTCTRCIDACPTDAIHTPYQIDASRCISYLTIELRDQIPSSFADKMDNWVFGCDVCQDVCPWNRFSAPHTEQRLNPGAHISMNHHDWLELTEETFRKVFGNTALKRTKYSGLSRNMKFLAGASELS